MAHEPRSGLAVEALVTILTVRFIPFFLILWIIGASRPAFLTRILDYVLNGVTHSQCVNQLLPDRDSSLNIPVRLRNAVLQRLPRNALHHLPDSVPAFVATFLPCRLASRLCLSLLSGPQLWRAVGVDRDLAPDNPAVPVVRAAEACEGVEREDEAAGCGLGGDTITAECDNRRKTTQAYFVPQYYIAYFNRIMIQYFSPYVSSS
jgi:hypothetical protein